MITLFTVGGIGYNTNEKGNRFFKIGDEKTTRISKAEYEAAFEQYTNDIGDVELEFDEGATIREAKKEMEEASDHAAEETTNRPKKSSRSLRKAAHRVEVDGQEIGLTEKHMAFLKNLPKCSYWDHGLDSSVWVFALTDTGMAGMTVGAMVSTLREKGLLRVMLGEVENMNGRTRREKYIELTDTGKKVAEVLGVE